jgi:hypothetical protein
MPTPFPAPYFKVPLNQPDAASGRNLLAPLFQTSSIIRPKIGGGRRRTLKKGGFLPSIGEGFAALAGKYIAPVALFGLYRLMNSKLTKRRNRYTKTRRSVLRRG